MSMTATIAQWVVRITGVLLLILGLLLWTRDVPSSLVPVHILLGVLMVLALWLLAATASQQGVPAGMAIGVALLGLVTLVFGLTQARLLQNEFHWVVQVVHLVLGMAAVGSGEMIGGRLRRMKLATA
jgi:O-antigen ligase